MKMVKLARPVLTFCVAIVAAFFSNSLSLVAQSDAAPMFPAELKQATQDVAIGQIEVARRAGQAKRQFEQRRQRQSQANNYGTSRQQSVLVGSESSPNERNKLVSSRQPIQSVSTGSMQTGESHRNPTDEGWFGTVMTIPDGKTCSGAKVVVHPPVSNGTNQYTFIVENLGAGSSEPFTVDFTTSNDVRVLQVFPFSASTSEHSVSVKFDGLGAYAQSKIHIKTTSATKGKFDFQAKVRMEKVQAFRVATTPSKTQEEPVSSNTSLASNSTTGNSSVSETPATNSAASVTSDERYKLASTAQQRKPVTEPTVSESEIEIAESDQNSHAATSDEKYLLTTSLAGPKALVPNQEYDFEIFASNTMASDHQLGSSGLDQSGAKNCFMADPIAGFRSDRDDSLSCKNDRRGRWSTSITCCWHEQPSRRTCRIKICHFNHGKQGRGQQRPSRLLKLKLARTKLFSN